MTGPLIIGVDTGASGALTGLNLKSNELEFSYNVPTHRIRNLSRKAGYTRAIDLYSISEHMRLLRARTALVVIETPGAMPGQGLASTFQFAKACGHMEGIFAGLGFSFVGVPPQTWKQALGLNRDKQRSLDMAKRLWPKSADLFRLKKHHDRAESALLCYYAQRHLQVLIRQNLDLLGEI